MNSYVHNELNKVKISTIPNKNITNIGTKAKNKFLLIIIILLLIFLINKKRFDKDNNTVKIMEY